MNTTISVVMPAYNAGTRINDAITSVLRQSRQPDEIIVVDDGSTDATAELAAAFDRIRLLRQKNQGAAAARQLGTEAARCEYIAYLDADDWWPVDKLAQCADILESDRVMFLLGDLQRALPGDPPTAYLPRNSTFFPRSRRFIQREAAWQSSEDCYLLLPPAGLDLFLAGFPPYPSTFVIRKTALNDVGGWDARFRRCQDFDLALRLARQYPVHYVDRVHAIIGLHAGNRDEYTYGVQQAEGDLRVLQHHLESSTDVPDYQRLVERALVHKLWRIGYAHRMAGQRQLAGQAYRRALAHRYGHNRAVLRWIKLWLTPERTQ